MVQGWMIKDLQLKGNELHLYAIIYGFTQTENQTFRGSLNYFAEFTNSTRQTVLKCLQSLEDKGLIGKIVSVGKVSEYYAILPISEVVKKFDQSKNLTSQKIRPDIDKRESMISIDNSTQEDNSLKEKNIKKRKGSQIPPTLQEVKDYCEERNNGIDPQEFIDFYTSKGWVIGKSPMKDWQAAIRTWEQKRKTEQPKKVNSNWSDYDEAWFRQYEEEERRLRGEQ